MDADWAAWCLCLGSQQPSCTGGAQYGQYLTPKFCTQRPRPPPRSVLMARLSSSARRRHTAQDYGSRHCRQANSDRLSHSMPGAGTIKRDGNGYVFAPVKNLICTMQIGSAGGCRRLPRSGLKRETGAAAARGFCLRIFHLERSTDQIVNKIDFRSGHVVD